MHTLLMMNGEAEGLYQDFSFLYKPFSDTVSICRVNEKGADFDEIFPDLLERTAGLDQWRAFVFVTEPLSALNPAVLNPFDISASDGAGGGLVRICQYLGGVQNLKNYEFEEYFYYIDRDGIKQEAAAIDEAFRAAAYASGTSIQRGYKETELPNGRPVPNLENPLANKPVEIYVVKLRLPYRLEAVAPFDKNFVDANGYPSFCRFLAYDLQRLMPTNQRAQLFGFWLSLLALLSNDTGANFLKAYELYSFKCRLDMEAIGSQFFQKLSKNRGVERFIERTLKQDYYFSERFGDEVVRPESVAIDYKRLDEDLAKIRVKDYPWVKDQPVYDVDLLRWQVEASVGNLREQLKEPRRQIANAALDARKKLDSYRDAHIELDKYQVDDVREAMLELQASIFKELSTGHLFDDGHSRELEQTKAKLASKLGGRLEAGVLGTLLFLVPALVFITATVMFLQSTEIGNALITGLVLLVLAALSGVATGLYHRTMTRRHLNGYNIQAAKTYQRIYEETGNIESRLENILNYMRYSHAASSVNKVMEENEKAVFNLRQYKARVAHFNRELQSLGAELGVDVSAKPAHDLGLYFNPDIPLEASPLFYLKPNRVLELPVKNFDYVLKMPYAGMDVMEIRKEG